jgi:hypothetical protein
MSTRASAAPARAAACPGLNSYCAWLTIQPYGLTGSLGSGKIASDPAGIDCTYTKGVLSGACSHQFVWPNSASSLKVTLVQTPDIGSVVCFKKAYCRDPGQALYTDYYLDSGADETYYAGFRLLAYTLTVSKTGEGTGRVTSDPAGIDCGSACAKAFDYGTKVTLTAKPDAGAAFKAWTGACSGQGATCTLTIAQDTSTNAVFGLPTAPPTTTTTTTTTTAAATTTTAPPQPPPSPAKTQPKTVDADVLAAKAGKSRLGARIVQVEIVAHEQLSVSLQLRRPRGLLAARSFPTVRQGDRVLTLLVPHTITAGRATLKITLTNAAGAVKGARRTVVVPRR